MNIRIDGHAIGKPNPTFIIAEAGVNHNGDMLLATRLVDAALAAGADAVKFQCFFTEELVGANTPKARYQTETTGNKGSQYDMLRALELSAEEHQQIREYCRSVGLSYLCTPYDFRSVDVLERIGIPAYKIASTDTTNIPLLRYVGSKGRPILMSTGFSTMGEIEQGMLALRSGGADAVALLHCVAEYPAPPEEANLRAIETLGRAFACPIGFSDHTKGTLVAPWAVAAGACIIEKHFTLDCGLPGPDHRASLDPDGFRELVSNIRMFERSQGDGVKAISPSEAHNKTVMQKSLVARVEMCAGTTVEAANLTCKRPGTGLAPSLIDQVVGRRTRRTIAAGEPVRMADLDWDDDAPRIPG